MIRYDIDIKHFLIGLFGALLAAAASVLAILVIPMAFVGFVVAIITYTSLYLGFYFRIIANNQKILSDQIDQAYRAMGSQHNTKKKYAKKRDNR